MLLSNIRLAILFSVLCLTLSEPPLQAAEPPAEKDKPFVEILEGAYRVSCDNVARLSDYYRSDAQIIHDGRLTTLDETIKEIKESIRPLKDLHCTYQPRVRTSRISGDMAYLLVRETIRLAAGDLEPQEIQQICSYVFVKDGSRWKIILDHCTTVPGETV
ncbi:MAG: nuclear transport factor 2 family protein [Nitrospirae bacterium]|nr:nuclear transport factor 2 family protein [Nitrospirota bacterium]